MACFFGALDDLWHFASRTKLVLQFLAVLPVVAAGFWIDRIVVFGCPITLGWLGVPLTILWLLGCINALNLIDGMDGLASIVGLSAAAMMSIIAVSMGNNHVAVIAVVLAGALAGFLVYNLPPASIFLGDSGSAVIGLVLGILGIQGAMKTSATLAITAPAVIMTLPMFDVVMAVVRRKLTGRRFDAADRQHIHHRLLDRGLRPWQVLCILGAFCLTTGAAATAATVFRWDALAWITALTLVVLMIRLRLFGHYEFALLKRRSSVRLRGLAARWLAAHAAGSRAPAPADNVLEIPSGDDRERRPEEESPLCRRETAGSRAHWQHKTRRLPRPALTPPCRGRVEGNRVTRHAIEPSRRTRPGRGRDLHARAGTDGPVARRPWPPRPTAWRCDLILVDNASAEGVEPWHGAVPQTRARPQSPPAGLRGQYQPHPARPRPRDTRCC